MAGLALTLVACNAQTRPSVGVPALRPVPVIAPGAALVGNDAAGIVGNDAASIAASTSKVGVVSNDSAGFGSTGNGVNLVSNKSSSSAGNVSAPATDSPDTPAATPSPEPSPLAEIPTGSSTAY